MEDWSRWHAQKTDQSPTKTQSTHKNHRVMPGQAWNWVGMGKVADGGGGVLGCSRFPDCSCDEVPVAWCSETAADLKEAEAFDGDNQCMMMMMMMMLMTTTILACTLACLHACMHACMLACNACLHAASTLACLHAMHACMQLARLHASLRCCNAPSVFWGSLQMVFCVSVALSSLSLSLSLTLSSLYFSRDLPVPLSICLSL